MLFFSPLWSWKFPHLTQQRCWWILVILGAWGEVHMMAECLLLSDMYLHFSTVKNLHFNCRMSRLTSVHVNISPKLEAWRPRTKDMPARYRGTQTERGRRRANIPTSWQKLTQAQMYLTNSPLLCMSKCEPDGSEQWGLARCLIVCGGYRRGTLELIRVEEQAFCRKAPNPSVTHHDTVI